MDCKNIFSFLFFFQGSKRWIPGRVVVQLHHCSKTCSGKYMCPYLQLEASLQAKNLFRDIIRNSIRGVFPCHHQILRKHLEWMYRYLLFLSLVLCFDPSAGKKMQRVFSSVPLSNKIFSWEGTPSSMQMSFTTVERGIGLLGFYNVSLSLFFFES